MSAAEKRLEELGHKLLPPAPAIANYLPANRSGNVMWMAGVGPQLPDGSTVTGKLGDGLTTHQGYEAARWCALNLLPRMKAELGDLDRVKQVVKLLSMVNCTSDFTEQPAVANGCSDLLVEVFGDAGRHARSAVGMGSLPMGIAAEIEAIVEVRD